MKIRIAVAAMAAILASFTIGHLAGQSEKNLNQKTLENLSTAMHGEALACAKFRFPEDRFSAATGTSTDGATEVVKYVFKVAMRDP